MAVPGSGRSIGRRRRTRVAFAVMLSASTATAACSSDTDAAPSTTVATSSSTNPTPSTSSSTSESRPTTTVDLDRIRFPGAEWDRATPADAGFDIAALDDLAERAGASNSACLAVTRNGQLIDSRHWPGATTAPREAYSVTKSVTAVLIGIAEREGLLATDDRVSAYVPDWVGTPSEAVTIEHLLSNTSGREWSLAVDYRGLAMESPDKTAYAVGLTQQANPGDVWAYNNSAIQVLDAVLEAATGMQPADYAQQRLFEPLGMADSSIRTDASGNTLLFMGLQSTCEDIARLGTMMLARGEWSDDTVLSSAFVEAATGRSSSDLNAGYGWLWWVNRPGRLAAPTIAVAVSDPGEPTIGQMAPGVAQEVFWALGLDGQYLVVDPTTGVVAVRLGAKPPDDGSFGVPEFTNAVVRSLTP